MDPRVNLTPCLQCTTIASALFSPQWQLLPAMAVVLNNCIALFLSWSGRTGSDCDCNSEESFQIGPEGVETTQAPELAGPKGAIFEGPRNLKILSVLESA